MPPALARQTRQLPDIEFPLALECLAEPARYKVLYGGRGGAKSWGVARALLLEGLRRRLRILCTRETQRSIADSVHYLLEQQVKGMGLEPYYTVQKASIQGRNGTEFIFAGIRQNVNSLKSYEACDICWVEEAQTVSKHSWEVLIPTIRKDGSEIWVTFNPDLESDETYKRFVLHPPPGARVVKLTWRDNPWFPPVLREEMEHLRLKDPQAYNHIYEGNCKTSVEGAIFGQELAAVEREGRICRVPYDPVKPVHTFWDLGWGDSVSVWMVQAIGFEFRVIDYLDGCQQALQWYLKALQDRSYVYGDYWLPHDAEAKTLAAGGRTIREQVEATGRKVRMVPRLGKVDQILAARAVFSRCWFDAERCADGLQSLRHYRYEYDEHLGTSKREPLHDWACFDFNTLVLTRYGTCRIMDLPRNGKVLTPCGWKRYQGPRLTQRGALLVEVRFKDGSTVRCTPDHLFLTESGWRSARCLAPNTLIRSSLTRSRSISMGVSTACGRIADSATLRAVARSYIVLYGKARSGLSRMAAIFTTGIETSPIIAFQTSNASLQGNIFRRLGSACLPVNSPTWRGKRHPSGTDLRRADCGIKDTPSRAKAGRNGSARRSLATGAARCLKRWFASLAGHSAGAPQYAAPLQVEAVIELPKRSDVCCIYVEDGHWFSLANGAVVHNSHAADAFLYMAVSLREPERQKQRQREKFQARISPWA